jgi:hypothetical protein
MNDGNSEDYTILKQETSTVVTLKFTDISKVRSASIIRTMKSIALMMGAVRISETSVIFNLTTLCYIPEDSKLHTRRCENLKSHKKQVTASLVASVV